jgi:2,4-dienoyl-CoA reductase-like NADH-dependent reductase (Old Yellow Enzyme family)
MASLFQEFRLKDVRLRNRIAVSPMCQYSSDNGFPNVRPNALWRRASSGWNCTTPTGISLTGSGRRRRYGENQSHE